MSVAVDADLADGDGGVSPKHQLTPRPTRSSRISPPPIPPAASTTQEGAGAVGAAGPAGHDGGEDAEHHTSGHEAAAATEPFPSMGSRNGGLSSFNLRADPDAQATVTDFLDFTEYLPSDMARSLTLIGKLDEDYVEASTNVHKLTDAWGQLPNMPAESRPSATKLRADISANLTHGINARVYAHAEALRMAENVNRHYFRAKTILSKLQTMLENYPEAEQQQQAQLQQKQQQQQQQREQEQQQQLQNQEGQKQPKKSSNGQQRMRRQRVPRITVPGEVLAPYDLDYESYSGESDVSSPSSDDESLPPHPGMRRKSTSAAPPRMKGLKGALSGSAIGGSSSGGPHSLKVPKMRVPRESRVPGQPYISTSSALARLKPPPENAVVGSADAPWLRLTAYELAKLRKRMKKNAQWSPSDTMIARELKALGRNLDAFNQARKKAEAEGRVFEGILPDAALELGAMNMDAALAAEESQLTNRGIRLNEAKKMKNDLGSLAAQEAEESTRRMMEAARAIFSPYPGATTDTTASTVASARATTPAATSRKRKREGPTDATVADTVEGGAADNGVSGEAATATSTPAPSASQRQLQKRVKTETPVPIPQPAKGSAPPHDSASSSNNTLATPAPPTYTRHSMTPVPAPVFGGGASSQAQDASQSRQSTAMSSPLSSGVSTGTGGNANTTTTTTTVPLKPPAETPIHPPVHKSTTPIHPPVRELRTREPARKDLPIHQQQPIAGDDAEDLAVPPRASRASSRALTPNPVNALGIVNTVLPTTETGSAGTTLATAGPTTTRRPSSRGASASAPNPEGQQSLASERPRRASTARNTPVPDVVGKRIKRPAPGVVSRTSSGGSAAVGQRKAAPRKKRRSNAHQNPPQNLNQSQNQQRRDSRGKSTDGDDVEIDDDGNIIDANEPRYCVCNRVSFGTMIQCDNVDNCKQEWFHLECVGLTAVPARTTKWYCPDCRVLLNIGEKGEVSARGVKA